MARSLRVEQQLTVDELAARLALPRSTIYYWVRDLPLRRGEEGREADDRPRGHEGDNGQEARGTAHGTARGDARRATGHGRRAEGGDPVAGEGRDGRRPGDGLSSSDAYEEGLESFEELASQPTFRDFVCIYLVQGEQRDRTRVALTNSDPAVMRLVSRWLRRLTDKAPFLSLQYRPGQSLRELRDFWGDAVGAEPRAIRAARRTAKSVGAAGGGGSGGGGGKGPRGADGGAGAPHGLLTVAVEDSLLRARMQGWMHRARESWR
ncbi:MAG TPA: hypothetical protein VL988_03650 [Solirubrobacteraceae bacterium]|nr:hypothetical protein [Solirubrobacteraceae bacterium]